MPYLSTESAGRLLHTVLLSYHDTHKTPTASTLYFLISLVNTMLLRNTYRALSARLDSMQCISSSIDKLRNASDMMRRE